MPTANARINEVVARAANFTPEKYRTTSAPPIMVITSSSVQRLFNVRVQKNAPKATYRPKLASPNKRSTRVSDGFMVLAPLVDCDVGPTIFTHDSCRCDKGGIASPILSHTKKGGNLN